MDGDSISADSPVLDAIKKKMSPQQRADMADLLANELRSRAAQRSKEAQKSQVSGSRLNTSLGTEQVAGMYQDVQKKLAAKKVEKLQKDLKKAKKGKRSIPKELLAELSASKMGDDISDDMTNEMNRMQQTRSPRTGLTSRPLMNIAVMGAVVVFALLKVMIETGVVDASMRNKSPISEMESTSLVAAAEAPKAAPVQDGKATEMSKSAPIAPVAPKLPTTPGSWSVAEKQILTELDQRRVELEKRRDALDRRESDLQMQEQDLSGRLVELRTLTKKLTDARQEKDQRYEARMEQLANVYGSMAPNEAAPLVARLDEEIGLSLLERMPGKRMGQILSAMERDRAVELTKHLTDRKMVDE